MSASEDLARKEAAQLHVDVKTLTGCVKEAGTRLGDAERRIEGLAKVAERHEARLLALDADRDTMKRAFDQRFAEIVQAYTDAETAFTERLAQMAAHNLGLSKHNANLKRDLNKSKGE